MRDVLYPEERIELVGWVEDESAHAFTVALLSRIDPGSAHRWALYWAKGKGDLEVLQRTMPRPAQAEASIEFAFFIDGTEQLGDTSEELWPMILLPGGASPDELFQRYAPPASPFLAEGLHMSEPVLGALLGEVEGSDPHDWTNDIAAKAGIGRPGALRVIANAVLESGQGEQLVAEFASQLQESGLRLFASTSD